MKKMVLLLCFISMTAMSHAAIIYQDDFSGSAGTDLNGLAPDVRYAGDARYAAATWVAGTEWDANGQVIFDSADMGASAYLPLVPQNGHIYTLSVSIDARTSGPRGTAGINDWIAMGFTQLNTLPNNRFYDDNGSRNPVYWAMSRTNQGTQNDQTFTGVGTTGGENTDVISQDNIKTVLNTTAATWTVKWYYADILKRTVNVDDTLKANMQYLAFTTARADGFVDNLLVTDVSLVAWNPVPADYSIDVSNTSVVLRWNKGRDPNDDPNNNVTGYTLRYISYDVDTAPAEPNFAAPGAVTQAVAVADPAQYPPTGGIAFGTDKIVYWRVDQSTAAGSDLGNVWRFNTIRSVPIILEQPVDAIAALTGSAQFAIEVYSTSPAHYAWYRSDDEATNTPGDDTLVGTDANTLTITNAAVSDEGYYFCKVTNDSPTTVYSSVVTLGVERKVAHWTLDALVSGQYQDTSGEGHHADPNGIPVFSAGASSAFSGTVSTGNGVTIDATNGFAVAGSWNPSQFTNQLTISMWAKWTGQTVPASWQGLIGKRTAFTAAGMMWQIEVDAGNNNLVYKNGNDNRVTTSPLPIGEWEFVAVTFNGTATTFYRDGAPAASGNVAPTTGTDAVITLGATQRNAAGAIGGMFNGMLDDIQIYNHARSGHQIADVYYGVTGLPVCIEEYASGFDTDDNCVVDLADFASLAAAWLDCGLYPTAECP